MTNNQSFELAIFHKNMKVNKYTLHEFTYNGLILFRIKLKPEVLIITENHYMPPFKGPSALGLTDAGDCERIDTFLKGLLMWLDRTSIKDLKNKRDELAHATPILRKLSKASAQEKSLPVPEISKLPWIYPVLRKGSDAALHKCVSILDLVVGALDSL